MAQKTQLEKDIDELGKLAAKKEEIAQREKQLKSSILHYMEAEGLEVAHGHRFKTSYVEESIYPQVDGNAVKSEFGDNWYRFAKWVHRNPSIRCYPLKKQKRS